jgi:hypothetical protein
VSKSSIQSPAIALESDLVERHAAIPAFQLINSEFSLRHNQFVLAPRGPDGFIRSAQKFVAGLAQISFL